MFIMNFKEIHSNTEFLSMYRRAREIPGMDAIIQAALVTTADFERMITTTKGCRFVGNKIYGLPMDRYLVCWDPMGQERPH